MRSDYVVSILLFFPVLLVQTTLVPFIAINGIVPDLTIILLVFYTLRNGQIFGTTVGFIYGFLFDIITGSLLGSAMFSKTITGFVAGYFFNENKQDIYFKPYVFSLIVLLCSILNSVLNRFFTSIDINTNIISLIYLYGLLPSLYTSLLSIILIAFYPRRSFN